MLTAFLKDQAAFYTTRLMMTNTHEYFELVFERHDLLSALRTAIGPSAKR